jgi:serine/threonine protein kinase
VIHRDLKPSNCLLTADWKAVKVADFGLSTKSVGSKMHNQSKWGNMVYVAPEVLLHHKGNSSMDVWSLAIILWELFSGASLFSTKDRRYQHVLRSATQGLALPFPPSFPPALKQLLTDCWSTKWDERPKCAEIEERLQRIHREVCIYADMSAAEDRDNGAVIEGVIEGDDRLKAGVLLHELLSPPPEQRANGRAPMSLPTQPEEAYPDSLRTLSS